MNERLISDLLGLDQAIFGTLTVGNQSVPRNLAMLLRAPRAVTCTKISFSTAAKDFQQKHQGLHSLLSQQHESLHPSSLSTS
jgi:hypothetical protein